MVKATDGRIKTFGQNLVAGNSNISPTSFEDAFKGYIEDWTKQGMAKEQGVKTSDVGVIERAPRVSVRGFRSSTSTIPTTNPTLSPSTS